LTGYNTDASGGAKALIDVYGDISKANLVILGAGGAANALASYLKPRVENIIILNRSKDKARALAERIDSEYGSIIDDQSMVQSADIILNATPIGMHPQIGVSPIDKKHLNESQLVYDIVYNPLKTQLLLDAEEIGARTLGGLWMLVHQGAKAFQIWTGAEANVQTMYEAAEKALLEMH
jgi:shikimate dehydrogenase